MNNYFTTQFWFSIDRVMLHPADKVIFYTGLAAVVLAIVIKLGAMYAPTPVDAKYRNKLFRIFLTVGISAVGWFGLRYQNVTFFGTHFIAGLIFLIGFIWLLVLAVKMLKSYSTEKKLWENEQVRMKYLPK